MDNLSESLLLSLPKVQTILMCSFCHQIYEKQWMQSDKHCFFCPQFRTNRITRYALLKETEWFFIQSGSENIQEFYKEYIYLVHRWCNYFQIPHTPREIQLEQELLQQSSQHYLMEA